MAYEEYEETVIYLSLKKVTWQYAVLKWKQFAYCECNSQALTGNLERT